MMRAHSDSIRLLLPVSGVASDKVGEQHDIKGVEGGLGLGPVGGDHVSADEQERVIGRGTCLRHMCECVGGCVCVVAYAVLCVCCGCDS